MPRVKPVHQGLKLLPVDCDKQLQPGSFEHALGYLVDHERDLTAFHARDKNDHEGAPTFAPAVLLKIRLLAYSRGMVSSRTSEAAGRAPVGFLAISGASQPHCTTLAAFGSALGDRAAKLFAQVLVICDRQGLSRRERCAIDGVKLASNASTAKSGSRKAGQRQAEKMEQAARTMLAKPRDADAAPQGASDVERTAKRLERLRKEARPLRDWRAKPPEDRQGSRGGVRLSKRPDNESATMATSQGVLQGYTGGPPWMRRTQSSSRPRRTARARNRHCAYRWSRPRSHCTSLPPSCPPMPAPTRKTM